jgi:hypothetical protein
MTSSVHTDRSLWSLGLRRSSSKCPVIFIRIFLTKILHQHVKNLSRYLVICWTYYQHPSSCPHHPLRALAEQPVTSGCSSARFGRASLGKQLEVGRWRKVVWLLIWRSARVVSDDEKSSLVKCMQIVVSCVDSSSSTLCIGLLPVAAPQIWLIHLFLGRPRLLFPVGLYDSMYRGKGLWSIRLMRLNQLSLYLLRVSLRLFIFNVFLIASLGAGVAQAVQCLTKGWTTRQSGFDPRRGQRTFHLASVSRPALGPTQLPVQWLPWVLSPGVKRGRGVMLTTYPHLVPRSWMNRSYTCTPPKRLHGV